jgi:HAD superfamily hydrolase (TIGR01509 family)
MPEKAIVFDVDGTLIDSVDLHTRAWQEAFAEFGKQLHFAELRSQIGKGADMLIPCFLNQEETERFAKKISKRQGEIFQQRYFSQVRPLASVPQLFSRLQKGGWIVALASSGKRKEVDHHKRLLGIQRFINLEVSADEVPRSKPHPDIFERVLKKLNSLDACRVLAVGDTPYDIEAAGKLGVRTIALLCGGFPEKQLVSAGAVAIFHSPAELLFRYEEWSHLVSLS